MSTIISGEVVLCIEACCLRANHFVPIAPVKGMTGALSTVSVISFHMRVSISLFPSATYILRIVQNGRSVG